MSLGLVGRKVGMTRIFAEDGSSIPVTVLDVSNNRVTQIKTPEIDGYAAIQVTFGKRRASRVSIRLLQVIWPRRVSKPGKYSRNSGSVSINWQISSRVTLSPPVFSVSVRRWT
jgi:ribosomal protein L3